MPTPAPDLWSVDGDTELVAFGEVEFPAYYRQPFRSIPGGNLSRAAVAAQPQNAGIAKLEFEQGFAATTRCKNASADAVTIVGSSSASAPTKSSGRSSWRRARSSRRQAGSCGREGPRFLATRP